MIWGFYKPSPRDIHDDGGACGAGAYEEPDIWLSYRCKDRNTLRGSLLVSQVVGSLDENADFGLEIPCKATIGFVKQIPAKYQISTTLHTGRGTLDISVKVRDPYPPMVEPKTRSPCLKS